MKASEIRNDFPQSMHNKLEVEKVAQLAELNEILRELVTKLTAQPVVAPPVQKRAELVSR